MELKSIHSGTMTGIAFIFFLSTATNAMSVQWTAGPGANGHYYEVIASPGITWDAAESAAIFLGGYLATVTSAEENVFVFGLTNQPGYWVANDSYNFGPLLGGFQPVGSPEPAGGWQWVNGEGGFAFTNWLAGEPNNFNGPDGNESRLQYFAVGTARAQTWNDLGSAFLARSYVVESASPLPSVVVIPGNAGPWNYSVGLNATFQYGENNHTDPPLFAVEAGWQLTIAATGTVDADGSAAGFGPVGPDGYAAFVANGGPGSTGTVFPSFHSPGDYPTNLLALMGVFTNASGQIVGTPFEVGSGPKVVIAPAGAARLQLGVNDDRYNDNTGSYTAKITAVAPAPVPGVVNEGGYLTISLTKQPGVTYTVQSAGSPDDASFSAETTTILVNNATTLKVRDNFLVSITAKRFMRAKLTITP